MKPRFVLRFLVVAAMLALGPRAFGQNSGTPAAGGADPIQQGQRVFTAGNSFHAWFVAPILRDMAQGAGIQGHVIVGESKIGGSQAIQHWNVPDAQNQAKAALRTGKVDVLTLACMLHPDEGIDRFAELGLKYNPDFRVSLQEFWIPFDKFEWPLKGNPDSVDFNAATVASLHALHDPYFKEMDEHVVALNARLGKQVVFVAPVGQAILALRGKIIAKQVPGIEKQSDLFADKIGHPQPPLETLVAYVHFSVIYRRTPVGLPLLPTLAKAKRAQWQSDDLNRVLQEIAWDAVIHHPLSGVRPPAPAEGKPATTSIYPAVPVSSFADSFSNQ